LLDLSNEITKIILSNPKATTFSTEEVSQLIGYTRDNSVFDLSNAITRRNTQQALKILLNILKHSNQETKIIAVLRDLFTKI